MAKHFFEAAQQLPDFLSGPLLGLDPAFAKTVTEIRLRSGRPVSLTAGGKNFFLLRRSRVSTQLESGAILLTHPQLNECFMALCRYSVHSYEQEICQGFFTISGGHRVGICGTAVQGEGETVRQIKSPSSLCIRIARVDAMISDERLDTLVREISSGILLAGPPGSGKTTLLRESSRRLSDAGVRVSIVDERRELWPTTEYGFTDPPPVNCDVLSGYPKHLGILLSLRSLSPQAILCDEVGGEEDARAIAAGANSGVGMMVTVHACTPEQLIRRPQTKMLLQTGAFSKAVFLSSKDGPGKVGEILDLDPLL